MKHTDQKKTQKHIQKQQTYGNEIDSCLSARDFQSHNLKTSAISHTLTVVLLQIVI